MTRRSTMLATVLALLTTLAACTTSETGSGPDGRPTETEAPSAPVVGTVPEAITPGTVLPPPQAVPSLDGVKAELRELGELKQPVAMTARPGNDNLYVAEQGGRVKRIIVDKKRDGDRRVVDARHEVDPRPILDLTGSISSGGERGLLGLTFSPDGKRLFLYYTARSGAVTIDEYQMEGDTIDVRSKRTVFELDHPRANHNGGQVAFGGDGFLYVGIGDGGGGGDPDSNGQNTATLYGTVLRIDPLAPAGGKGYGIPAGNPFANGGGAPEIWAFGLRNPWRFGFDQRTQDLWIGDVGQNEREEIDFLPHLADGAGRGANLGWSEMEGSQPFLDGAPPPGYVPPIFDYGRPNGECSVVGGYVYRGASAPAWNGVYFWADYCRGEIHTLLRGSDGRVEDRGTGLRTPDGDASGGSITSFGQDLDGELYVLSAGGHVYQLVPDS